MPISKLFPVTKSTETLSLRPKFPVLMPRLLYETIFFVPFRRRSKRWQKSLMSHSGLQVVEVASHLTPVPGGVGPMTVAMLMYNTVQVMSPNMSFSEFTNFNSYENILSFSGRCSRTWGKIAKKHYRENQLRSEDISMYSLELNIPRKHFLRIKLTIAWLLSHIKILFKRGAESSYPRSSQTARS